MKILKPAYLPLVLLAVIFLILRLAVLFSGTGNLVYDLETNIGTYAKLLLDGVSPGFLFQHYDNYRWGGLILAGICVPFFKLFGPHLVVLRLVAMLFSLGTLVLGYLLLDKFFSRKAAILAGLFFIFMPPNPLRFSLTAMGGYSEINFFFLLAALIFFKIFFGERPVPVRLYTILGAICGFALFYDYTFFLALAACIIFWFFLDRRAALKKEFYIFLAGFILGFGPWFYYQAAHGWSGMLMMRDKPLISWFGLNGISGSLIELKDLLLSGVPRFFGFKDVLFLKSGLLSYAYYLAIVYCILWLVWKRKAQTGRKEGFLFIYAAIFLAARAFCGVSFLSPVEADVVFPERFTVFLLPALYLLCAVALSKMWSSGGKWPRVAGLLSAVILAAGISSNLGLVRLRDPRIWLIPQGYNYLSYGKQMRSAVGARIGQVKLLLPDIEKKERRFFLAGFRWALPREFNGARWAGDAGKDFSIAAYIMDRLLPLHLNKVQFSFACENLGHAAGRLKREDWHFGSELSEVPAELELPFEYFYRGLGSSCLAFGLPVDEYIRMAASVPEKYRGQFYRGVGTELDRLLAEKPENFFIFIRNAGPAAAGDIYAGFSEGKEYPVIGVRSLAGGLTDSLRTWEPVALSLGKDSLAQIYQRLGIELGWRFLPDLDKAREILSRVKPEYGPAVYRGIGIGLGWRFGDDLRLPVILDCLDPAYRQTALEGIKLGQARRRGDNR